jgi:hypothetical protein
MEIVPTHADTNTDPGEERAISISNIRSLVKAFAATRMDEDFVRSFAGDERAPAQLLFEVAEPAEVLLHLVGLGVSDRALRPVNAR